MAGMDGIATARAIQRLELTVVPKIIMVSAYGRVEEIGDIAAAGITLHLLKPITSAMLVRAILDVFGLELPAQSAPIDPEKSALTGHLVGLKVLLADDVEVNLLVAQELLVQAGCEVEVVSNGQDAVEQARVAQPPFALVLMDIQMPDVNGYEATRRIRALGKTEHCDFQQLPILAMTAHAMPEEIRKCKAAGMNDHLSKPIYPKALLTMVEKWGKGNSE